ncbi:MAG: penicillin-binding protein 2 [bacterium]
MESYDGQKLTDSWRMVLIALLFSCAILFLANALYHVQVVQSPIFSSDQARQSLRRVQVPGTRGKIVDRNGVCLAENRASYCIAYYVEELRKRGKWINTINAVNENIDKLANVLGIPRDISYASVSNHVIRSLPMPLIAWKDVDPVTLARWAENADQFPGVDVYVQPERSYPEKMLAVHLLGYVRRDRPPRPRPGEEAHFYLPEMYGAVGLESTYNDWLTGQLGEQLIRVDARGYKNKTWDGEPAVAGRDLTLTLDVTIQRALESALFEKRGAGVVIDPHNGAILAMASMPTFDPNEFIPVIRQGVWKRLVEDENHPLFNRAIQGRYAPGSIFKPVTAFAALGLKDFDPDAIHTCLGTFELGTMRLRCWDTYGHQDIALRKAIEQSCNSYFCNLGNKIGFTAIYAQAEAIGLGSKTGIDLTGENAGLLPDEQWKLNQMNDRWRPGDTCQLAIGQGLLLVTPLQMALVAATIANGGKVYQPHLVKKDGAPEPLRKMDWSEAALAVVKGGMQDVVTQGTGRRVQVRGTNVSAKTGTAEVDVNGKRHKNTWLMAYAPTEAPQVAIAMVIEDGESGGKTVAPLVKEVLVSIFGEHTNTLPVNVVAPLLTGGD